MKRSFGMLDTTKNSVNQELSRARKKYPGQVKLTTLDHFISELKHSLELHARGKGYAVQIGANATVIAALAIRIHEEGADGFPYQRRASGELNFDVGEHIDSETED